MAERRYAAVRRWTNGDSWSGSGVALVPELDDEDTAR